MSTSIAMVFDIADADILEEVESIKMKAPGHWVGAVIKDYDTTREVGTLEAEDGSTLLFSRGAVCCLKYNGGRTCIAHRWPHTKDIKQGVAVLAHTNGVNTGTVLIWQPEKMRPVCNARSIYSKTRFVLEGSVVWNGFGYYLIGTNFPKDEYPLSENTYVEVFTNGEWTKLQGDPRDTEYSQCSK